VNAELFTFDGMVEFAQIYIVPFAINLLLAIIVFVIGRWGARLATRIFGNLLRRAHTEESLVKFIGDVVYALLLTIVVIAALERLGIKTTAAVAVIGAAGLAVGLALQGSLGNFASGVLIMLFKPYRVGDTVQVVGKLGTVESVHIFTTVLHTADMVKVIIPNGAITASTIENLSALGTRRLQVQLAIARAGDLDQARAALQEIARGVPGVLEEPTPAAVLVEVAQATATFALHASVKAEDTDAVRAEIIERARRQFDERLVTAKAV
jgi:small conductance mechanosensitive channel